MLPLPYLITLGPALIPTTTLLLYATIGFAAGMGGGLAIRWRTRRHLVAQLEAQQWRADTFHEAAVTSVVARERMGAKLDRYRHLVHGPRRRGALP